MMVRSHALSGAATWLAGSWVMEQFFDKHQSPLYVALGWVAVFVLPDILDRGGVAALVLLLVGGAAYTVGAVFYALRRPNPWPQYFGHHEFFHACTLVAAICHHIAMYFALYA